MRVRNISWVFCIVLAALFSTGCGAGMVSLEPTLPWEGTQPVPTTSPTDETEETATSPPDDPPTATVLPSDTPPPTLEITPTQDATPTLEFTPSLTPTQAPAGQIAPADSNFNNPLNIPLDTTASVTDFVSYPSGDTIDRVRFDVSGMNSNASLSGGRARLILAVSCFGNGIQDVTFFTGGQTYSCGQTIFDNEITFDSRTGMVTIEAIGGESTYVQWVLTGTATRVN